jgi:hypothetical protein
MAPKANLCLLFFSETTSGSGLWHVLYRHVREDERKGSGADPLNRESDLCVLPATSSDFRILSAWSSFSSESSGIKKNSFVEIHNFSVLRLWNAGLGRKRCSTSTGFEFLNIDSCPHPRNGMVLHLDRIVWSMSFQWLKTCSKLISKDAVLLLLDGSCAGIYGQLFVAFDSKLRGEYFFYFDGENFISFRSVIGWFVLSPPLIL